MESLKRSSYAAGLDVGNLHNSSSIDSDDSFKSDDRSGNGSRPDTPLPKNGKKTRGRVKINMEFIDNKLRRYTTFSKRKSGIMKKAHELATLTGTQVMLLVASETGHVYTFATRKLQPILSSEAGKQLIQTCLNSPDANDANTAQTEQDEQRMSAQGFEETELSYAPPDDTKDGLLQKTYHMLNAISAQQNTVPSSSNEHRNTNQTLPVDLVTMNNNSEPNKSTQASSQPSFTLLSASAGSAHLDQHRLLAHSAAGAVRMQMLSPEGFAISDNTHPTHHQLQPNIIGRPDENHLALFNHTFPIQRPITGIHPVLVETSQTNNIISTQHQVDTTRPR